MKEEQNNGEGATTDGQVDVKILMLLKPAFDTLASDQYELLNSAYLLSVKVLPRNSAGTDDTLKETTESNEDRSFTKRHRRHDYHHGASPVPAIARTTTNERNCQFTCHHTAQSVFSTTHSGRRSPTNRISDFKQNNRYQERAFRITQLIQLSVELIERCHTT